MADSGRIADGWGERLYQIAPVCIAVLAVVVRLWVSHRTHALGEDALITLRYAENIAAGHGWVYNPGERVLGTTTPLFTILLALAAWLHLPAMPSGVFVCCAADGVHLFQQWPIEDRHGRQWKHHGLHVFAGHRLVEESY